MFVDESSRQHEAAYGLLSLSQKTATSAEQHNSLFVSCSNSNNINRENVSSFMDNEEIVLMTKTNFAKNKILDQQEGLCLSKHFNRIVPCDESVSERIKNVSLCLGKFISNRPLTYPYTSLLSANETSEKHLQIDADIEENEMDLNIKQLPDRVSSREYSSIENKKEEAISFKMKYAEDAKPGEDILDLNTSRHGESRKRKLSSEPVYDLKILKEDSVMDLSINSFSKRDNHGDESLNLIGKNDETSCFVSFSLGRNNASKNLVADNLGNQSDSYASSNEKISENGDSNFEDNNGSPRPYKSTNEYDNSAMETLADIATKQIKLEKNSVAKNVATEFLKLATKIELKNLDRLAETTNFIASNKDVNDIILKREENKSCTICSKNFSKPSQLR